jgi:hypothetical protein
MSYHVSLDFSEKLSFKSGGQGQGRGREGQLCLPRPSATALFSAEGNNTSDMHIPKNVHLSYIGLLSLSSLLGRLVVLPRIP